MLFISVITHGVQGDGGGEIMSRRALRLLAVLFSATYDVSIATHAVTTANVLYNPSFNSLSVALLSAIFWCASGVSRPTGWCLANVLTSSAPSFHPNPASRNNCCQRVRCSVVAVCVREVRQSRTDSE